MRKRYIETDFYGTICLVERYDIDFSESFVDMYQDDEDCGYYYGELWCEDIDSVTSDMVEEQIIENLNC